MSARKKRRILIARILLLLGTAVSLFFVPWLLVKAWILPLPKDLQGQLDQAVNLRFDGVVCYVEQCGQAPQFYASGWHDRDAKKEARPDALFKIASISKLYDAVALSKLVGDGRLSLDMTLAEYLPSLVGQIENAKEITLRMMVQHRSGIPNFTDAPNFWSKPSETYEESLALIAGKSANFKPGKKYEYCNTNYLFINKIMDNELGFANFQFIRERILIPLQLKNTFDASDSIDMDKVMSGYHMGYPYDLKQDGHDMLASAEDVGIFIRALNDGSVFEGKEFEIYKSIYEFEHSGWVPGYQSFAKYNKDLDAVIVGFYNTTDKKLYNWNLSQIINRRIARIIKKQNLKCEDNGKASGMSISHDDFYAQLATNYVSSQ